MKYIILIVVLAALAGGWYIWTNEAEAPIVNETNDQIDPVQENDSVDAEVSDAEDEDTAQPVTEESETKVFNVSAKSFEFDVTEMRVQEGDTVTINLSVTEGFHDLVIDEFGVATPQMTANGYASVTFVADAAGTYEYYCSVGSHRALGMVGTLIVE